MYVLKHKSKPKKAKYSLHKILRITSHVEAITHTTKTIHHRSIPEITNDGIDAI